MASPQDRRQLNLTALGAALPLIIIFITVLSIPLSTAQELGLSTAQITSWILVLYGLPGLLTLVFTFRYRQPLLFTGNLFVLVFVSSLGGQISYPALIGAAIIAGVIVLLIGALGLSQLLASWVPAPVVLGLLAGAIVPFVSNIFTVLGDEPLLVGVTLMAYIGGRIMRRTPAILPALFVALLSALVLNRYGQVATPIEVPTVAGTLPHFSLNAIATATPVLVVLITLQANLPSLIYMQNQGYEPPDRAINSVSGFGTVLGTLLGPMGVSLSLPATSLVAGPAAGDLQLRYRAAYIAGSASVLIGLLAGVAAILTDLIPIELLIALTGLALVDVLAGALHGITRGPLFLGPLFAFVVALSEMSLLGLGPFFWALVIGSSITALLESDEWKKLRETPEPS